MKKIYTIMFFVSLALFAASVITLAVYGLNFGVDFKGGSVLEIEFLGDRPDIVKLDEIISEQFPGLELSFNPSGEKNLIIRTAEIAEGQHQEILGIIKAEVGSDRVQEKR